MNDYTAHKVALEAELSELEHELSKLGVQNPKDPAGWEVKTPELDIMQADENEVGDRNEEMQVNTLILDELAVRYKNITRALGKMANGTYGVCEVSGEQIEEDRLQANPAARTCKKHVTESEKLEV